ncbi:DUF2235 domain-containing protein [Phaeovulum sp.]|uniref:DUF2235 domain-containing protein n=1 Tax=Phaeovulum sp. TaxID=2934796 RepID=UPI0039E3D9B4
MPKTIVILLDGTSNTITEKRTNILRLYGCLRKNETQTVYYDPGVGTIGIPGVWSRRAQAASEVWEMASGMGVDDNVKEAYRFLVETYEDGKAHDTERDRICIFGFSRGAYTARMLAGFIHTIGLLPPRNLNLLDHAWRAYKRIGETESDADFAEVRLYERILDPDRPPIHLLGLYDTVSSVIEPGPGIVPRLRHHAFTTHNPSVAHVRHAVALDERRRMFEPVLWPEGKDHLPQRFQPGTAIAQDVREVWFTGCHGDVGGGQPEAASALAKIPLLWMIEQTKALGLDYITQTVNRLVRGAHQGQPYVAPDAFAQINESMKGAWKLLEYLPLPTSNEGLKLTRGRRRRLPAGLRIHASAVARHKAESQKPMPFPPDYRIEGDIADWTPAQPSNS